jgi:uncharacterized protein YggU (UPF0235/DUF167 family)
VEATLSVRVTPKAGCEEAAGLRDGELLVRVTAGAEGGKANAATCRVVAALLGVPKTSVRVMRGGSSRRKLLAIDGIDETELRERLVRAHP